MATAPVYCKNHPARETLLRCNRCNDPYCINCLVRTPVGYRCKTCLNIQQAGFYTATVTDHVIAGIVGFIASIIGGALAVASVILWGVVMAVHETTMRAAIADIAPVERRASAYGAFNIVYGAAWFVGGAAMGWLYDFSTAYPAVFVVAVEVVSLPVFWAVTRSGAMRRPE